MLDFQRSADVLLVLVIGGTGYLYGGLIGAVVFKLLQDCLASITPQYWQFWIGLLLVVLVLVGRERIDAVRASRARTTVSLGAQRTSACARARVADAIALETTRPRSRRFGGITATNDVTLRARAGRAPRADRPERRRQDHARSTC